VHTDVDGDVFFPEINMEKWKLIFSEKHCKDEKNEFDYTFKIFDKI